MTVVPVTAEEVRELRSRVLRPHQSPADQVYPGDGHPLALHAGALAGAALIAVATIAPEGHPTGPEPGDWRLRGMATAPEARGRGLGGELLGAVLSHAREHGGRRVWCNARVGVSGFYERYGFAAAGPVFQLPDIGDHVRMACRL